MALNSAYRRHPLDGPRLKAERALEHLEALDAEWAAFRAEREPHSIEAQFDAKARCHVAVLRVHRDPPPRLSLIFGDLIHNLRSALDHIAWSVARLDHPGEELMKSGTRKKILFPITQAPKEFAAHSLIPFISEQAKTIFEGTQPYNGPIEAERHPLASLNRLSNADKHRLLTPVIGAVDITSVRYRPAAVDVERLLQGGITFEQIIRHGDPVEDGTKVAYLRFPGDSDPHRTKMDVQGTPHTDIVFADRTFVVGIGDLRDLIISVRMITSAFEPLFPSAAH